MATHIKLNIHSSCISYYLIQGSKQIKYHMVMTTLENYWRASRTSRTQNIFQVLISYSTNLKSQSNACTYECMPYITYLIASQHLCINAWSYHMHVHGRIKETLEENPNQTCEEKQVNREIETQKHKKGSK